MNKLPQKVEFQKFKFKSKYFCHKLSKNKFMVISSSFSFGKGSENLVRTISRLTLGAIITNNFAKNNLIENN